MRAVFLGTPDAAVPSLDVAAATAEVALVVTRPDRPRGRSGKPQPPPVKEAALRRGLPTAQPESSHDIARLLSQAGPVDVAVLVAYGMLIRPEALAVPAAGFVNVHFSLLPRWRGAAPVHRAIMAGDDRTGVALMRLDRGLDTGPVLVTHATRIGDRETTGTLTGRLATAGAELLGRWLGPIVEGKVAEVAQDELEATYAPKIDGDERRLDLGEPPPAVDRKVRALSPFPGAWAEHETGRVRVLETRPAADAVAKGKLAVSADRLLVGVAGGSVELVTVQPAGRRPMSGADWARGRHGDLGTLR